MFPTSIEERNMVKQKQGLTPEEERAVLAIMALMKLLASTSAGLFIMYIIFSVWRILTG